MRNMEERSLRITGADKNFFNKITTTLTKILAPTKIGLNSMLISIRRNSLMKAFEVYQSGEENYRETEEEKYKAAYENYLEALDKYVMDSIYKKVRNDTASEFEKNALAKYYEVITLKENEYVEYKNRKQKYLIDLDYENVKVAGKEKVLKRFEDFYVHRVDVLYKSILKNYSIKLADATSNYDSTKDWIYTKIFLTLDDYVENILPLKINNDPKLKEIVKEYEKYEGFTIGKLDARDNIEKNKILIGISRLLFTHSLPLIVAEQCYEKLLKDTRMLIQDTKIAAKRERVYNTLISLIEDYNVKLLSKKVYWDRPQDKEQYKQFWDKYKEISKLKNSNFDEYNKQKEILFVREELKKVSKKQKIDYSKIQVYYKRKLIDYGAMKTLKNSFKSDGKYIKVKGVLKHV